LRSARITIASIALGSPARSSLGGTGWTLRILPISASRLSPLNGRRPVSSS
jgi:hypothetical protein